jgi:hypothetical protein
MLLGRWGRHREAEVGRQEEGSAERDRSDCKGCHRDGATDELSVGLALSCFCSVKR